MFPLGFGLLRLPVKNNEPTDFDYETINQMVDEFLQAGFTYFDTSYVYHKGKSEEATKKFLVQRHKREEYTIATKFPIFSIQKEEQIEPIFSTQLQNLGVDYIDYYLIHSIKTDIYDGYDGREGIIHSSRIFDHAKKWKEEGKIKHIGISFHSTSKLLDRILNEHPEIEFVQIALNYYDWEGEFVQSRLCYETIRKHGKKVVIMEPVRGGFLSNLPKECESLLKERNNNASLASWALRFTMDLDGVIAVLSGMSSIDQMRENISLFRNPSPLLSDEKLLLRNVVDKCKKTGPLKISDFSKYKNLTYIGVPVSAILDAYNSAQIQPRPDFCLDSIYLRSRMLEDGNFDCKNNLPKQKVVMEDGTDITEMVENAAGWLRKHFL